MTNSIVLSVYSSGTTQVNEPELANAQGVSFSTIYPGGRFASLACFIPRKVTQAWQVREGYRIVARNGTIVVWEGKITGLAYTVGAGAQQGIGLTAAGMWGQVLEKWTWEKRWADNRITEDAWVSQTATGYGGSEQALDDRKSRIRITPKGVAWPDADAYAIVYSMPTGETIKRVTCSRDFQEGAQAWELRLRDTTGAANIWSLTSSTTDTDDSTLGTPRQTLNLQFLARAAQTPTEDGVYYGEISSVVMYSETGNINLTEIATDIVGENTDLNTSTAYIGSNTYSLVPFITDGQETHASILTRAAAFGDASFNSWACYLRESDYAPTPNGNGVLVVEQYPVLTSYDYAVRIDEENVQPPLTIVKDADGVYNWIVVRYRDELGVTRYLSPDDNSNLTDSTSVTTYGKRATVIDGGEGNTTTAANIGRRKLAASKDAKFYVSAPVTVKGYVRGSSGQPIPAANITAGKRLKIENFLTDQVGVTGAGLTFIVSKTDYDDTAQTNSMTCGIPDDMSIFLAQLAAGGGI